MVTRPLATGPSNPAICGSDLLKETETLRPGALELDAPDRYHRVVSRPCLSFLSDFGLRDFYVASVKAVILGICEDVRITDISHQVPPHDIREAAFTLASCYYCFPPNSIHLVVVDPGVGSDRRAVIASSSEHVFVSPDNGVLSLVLEKEGIEEVVEIQDRGFYRQPVAPTFHGRDILGPVAAHLARGVPARNFGPLRKDFVRLNINSLDQKDPDMISATVIHIDRFGNVITNVRKADLLTWLGSDRPGRLEIQGRVIEQHCRYYAEARPDEPFSILGSSGFLEIAAFSDSAARILGVGVGSSVKVTT